MLVEKQHTVADAYPLTLNALVAGCNQKTSREPLMQVTDTEAQAALDGLRERSLVLETSGGRVMRYAHNVGKVLAVPPQSVALLATLFLRGPQTAGELRLHSERLHRFGDILSVEAFLAELAERPAGALVRELPRVPGARETRWAHLLCGEPLVPEVQPEDRVPRAAESGSDAEVAEMKDTIARLQGEVDELKALVERICAAVGIAR